MKLLLENWREYLNEDKKNNYHALLIIEAAETNNEDLFFENIIYLNEGMFDSMKSLFFDKPVEVVANLIEKIGTWVEKAFEWAASKVPDEWSALKTLANKISDVVSSLVAKASGRGAFHIATTLIKYAYIALLLKAIAIAILSVPVSASAAASAAAVAKAASAGSTAIDVLQTSLTADPAGMAQGAASAIEYLQGAILALEGAKILGYASGKLSIKRGVSVFGKRLFKGDTSLSPMDALKGLVAEYKVCREKAILRGA